jgi:hypothetical protein
VLLNGKGAGPAKFERDANYAQEASGTKGKSEIKRAGPAKSVGTRTARRMPFVPQGEPVLDSYSNPWLSFLCAFKRSGLRSFVIQSRASMRGR